MWLYSAHVQDKNRSRARERYLPPLERTLESLFNGAAQMTYIVLAR